MNIVKQYTAKQLAQLKSSAAALLGETITQHDGDRSIELDAEAYRICSEWAEARDITVDDAASQLIHLQWEERRSQLARQATRQQIEGNPLLALDALAALAHAKGETDDE